MRNTYRKLYRNRNKVENYRAELSGAANSSSGWPTAAKSIPKWLGADMSVQQLISLSQLALECNIVPGEQGC